MKLTEIEFRITTDWHYRLGEFYNQYPGVGMTLHAAFCSVLSTIVLDYESGDPDTQRCLKRAEKLSGQFQKQEDML